MADVESFLHGQTAGLPNAVWIAGIGGVVIYAVYKRKHATVPNSNVASDGSTSGTIEQSAAPAQFLPISPPTNGPGNPAGYATNADWSAAALAYVIGNAATVKTDPISATNAIGAYLNGLAMTAEQARIINAIESGIGPPPILPDQVNVLSPPKPPVAPPPVPVPDPVPSPTPNPIPRPVPHPHRYYTVIRGDNLTAIGRKFGLSWQAIYNANRNKIRNPNLIYPGQVLLIP